MLPRWHPIRWGLLCSFLLLGCGKSPVGPVRKAVPRPPVRDSAGPLLDEADAEQFAAQLIQHIQQNNHAAASQMVDWRAILETSWSGITASETIKTNFERGFMQQIAQPGSLMHSLADRVTQGGQIALLRIRERDGRRTALVRILMNPGVNYMEFALERQPDGIVRATDVYIFTSAEWFSTTLRRFCLPVAAQADRTLVDRLLGNEQLFVKHLKTISQVVEAGKQQRWQELLTAYQALPDDLQKDKNMLLMRYRAASELADEQQVIEAIEVLRQTHRRDPCVAFLSIDYYTIREEYDKALQAIDLVDESVGGDMSLATMRASIQSLAGDEAGAEANALQAIDDPLLAHEAYNVLFANAVRYRKYTAAVKWLDEVHALTPLSPDDVRAVPENAAFVQSPEFLDWVAKQ